MLIIQDPEHCKRGLYAIAYAEGKYDKSELEDMAARLAQTYGITRPDVKILHLNAAERSSNAVYVIIVTQNDR